MAEAELLPPGHFFLKEKKSNKTEQKPGFRLGEKHRVEQGGGGKRLEQPVTVISMKIQSNFRKSRNILVQQLVNELSAVAAGHEGSVWNTTNQTRHR